MSEPSQDYLDKIRITFEKKYKRKLTETEVKIIAFLVLNFGKVIQNFYQKKKLKYGDKYDIWFEEFIDSAESIDK